MPTNYFDLSGKVALITGGSRGLGFEMAKAFAEAGCDIAIASRKVDSCESAATAIRKLGRKATAHACHVGQWSALQPLVEDVYRQMGRVDILVNNAGMSPLAPSSVDTSEDLFDKIVGVNFKGPYRLTALIGSRMVRDGGGAVINISSTGAIRPHPSFIPYAGAKAALNAITQGFAAEYAPTVRVNSIMAGPFLTDIAKAWTPEAREKANNLLGRPGQPNEIVTAALYLASPSSSFVTGSVITCAGGVS